MTERDAFEAAADFVETSLRQGEATFAADEVKLRLYGLYKQALFGPVKDPQPSVFRPKLRAKWTAWKCVCSFTQEEAKEQYVELVSERSPGWDGAQSREAGATGPVFSRPAHPSSEEDDAAPSPSRRVLTLLLESQMCATRWRSALQKDGTDPAVADDSLRNALHWAADAGRLDAIQFLLETGLFDVNSQDNELMTPLHYAALCGHYKVAEQLLAHGARRDLRDASGEAALDSAPREWDL